MSVKEADPDGGNDLEQYDVDAFGVDTDSDRFDWFADKVLKEAGRMVTDNANHHRAPDNDVDGISDVFVGVLSPDNVREVQIRNKEFADPRVTFWLKDAPIWANDADTRKLVSTDTRDDCHVVIDVRPF